MTLLLCVGISHLCKEDAILATNSLYLDITSVMDQVHRPEVRVLLSKMLAFTDDGKLAHLCQLLSLLRNQEMKWLNSLLPAEPTMFSAGLLKVIKFWPTIIFQPLASYEKMGKMLRELLP